MRRSQHLSYNEPESSSTKWVIIFVALSLLAHAVIFLGIILVSLFVPSPPLPVAPPEPADVSLSLIAPPPPAPPRQKPKTMFLPTRPDPTVKPNPDTTVISDNNLTLKSENKQARQPDAILPDVTGKKNHSLDLQDTPLAQSTPTPEVNSTPPMPKEDPAKQQPTPPQPQPTPATQPTPKPDKPTPKPPDPKPPKPPTPPPPKPPPPPQVDPLTGLPVLPPIIAPTLAAPTAASRTQSQKVTSSHPPPAFQLDKSDVAGSASASGPNSVAANATSLGRYKAKIYRAVGSRWYQKVGAASDIMPVGVVRIQYTIYSDGTVTTKVLDGGNSTMQTLLSISINSIREAAPFDTFDCGSYPGIRDELMKTQGGDGSSLTDDFSFSVY